MRTRSLLAAAFLIGAFVLPGVAAAQTIAYAVPGSTNLRARPGTQFPVIAVVAGGSRVDVYGCLEDHSWCDVLVEDIRGWMYAGRLQFVYGGQRVYVPEYYPYFGAPIIGFDFRLWDDGRRRRSRDSQQRDNERTECLAPEGFCPGDRPRRNQGGYEDRLIVPGPTQDPGDLGATSGSAEIVISPGAEGTVIGPDSNRGGGVECLAPDGFCP